MGVTGVIVPGMIVFMFFLPRRDRAIVRRLARRVFQLDRRVVNAKPLPKSLVDLAQNRVALRSRHVRDLDVRRERVVFRPNAPQM